MATASKEGSHRFAFLLSKDAIFLSSAATKRGRLGASWQDRGAKRGERRSESKQAHSAIAAGKKEAAAAGPRSSAAMGRGKAVAAFFSLSLLLPPLLSLARCRRGERSARMSEAQRETRRRRERKKGRCLCFALPSRERRQEQTRSPSHLAPLPSTEAQRSLPGRARARDLSARREGEGRRAVELCSAGAFAYLFLGRPCFFSFLE